MKELFFLLLLLFFPTQLAFAENLVMHVNQSAYYFLVGENSIIPLEIENYYGRQISGILQHTIEQQIAQANTQFSSSNTQSSAFTINDGKQLVLLSLGSSNSPLTLILNLNFKYNDGNETSVSLGPINVYFVSDESEKNNAQNTMQSSSQQSLSAQGNQANSQQSLQQQLDKLAAQTLSQDSQQRLQNNQLFQNSDALKQEIQQQLQEENTLKQEFEKQLEANEDFQKPHNKLLEQGYAVTNKTLDPTSTSTGNFQINYKDEQGKWAKLQGSMINGTISDIQKQTQKERENLLSKLRNNSIFKEYENQLIQEGFTEQNIELVYGKENTTSILLRYQNEKIQNATITANFTNGELVNVALEKSGFNYLILILFLIIIFVCIMAYLSYKKFMAKKKVIRKTIVLETSKKFDHVLASNNLIKEAKKNFNEEKYKDAYSKVIQAIRLFLSYELNLNKEITNEDILLHLDTMNYPIVDIENCFKFSSLVEFARHREDKNEFDKMIVLAKDLIEGTR